MINYKYNILLSIMDVDGRVYNYSDRVTFLTILDDYMNSVNSAIKIGFFVSPTMHNILNLRASKMTYTLSVTSTEVSPYQQTTTNYRQFYLENFKIKPINVPNSIYKSDDNASAEGNTDFIQVVMDFIPATVLTYNRYMCNGIYNDVTVNDVILYLLNKMKLPVIYEEPDNTKRYSQIILPPNNLFMSFKFLQQHYGIYNNGLSMWFKGNVFCLKNTYNSDYTPKINQDNVNNVRIYVNKSVKEYNSMYGEGTKHDMRLNIFEYYTKLEKILIEDNIISLEELYGNNHMIYSRNLDETYITDTTLNYKENEDKLKLYWNGIENPTVLHQYFNQLRNSIRITVDYKNSNLGMWSPLNRFRFHIMTNNIAFDKYVYNYFQVARNEMFFTVNGTEATLEGKATLIDIGKINGYDQDIKFVDDYEVMADIKSNIDKKGGNI